MRGCVRGSYNAAVRGAPLSDHPSDYIVTPRSLTLTQVKLLQWPKGVGGVVMSRMQLYGLVAAFALLLIIVIAQHIGNK